MNNKILSIIIVFLLFAFACKESKLEVAEPIDIPMKTLAESFIARPVCYQEGIVGLVQKDYDTEMVRYNLEGERVWSHSIDDLILGGYYSLSSITYFDINKNTDNTFLFNQYHGRYFRSVKYNGGGGREWDITDTFQQPDTIVLGVDTFDLTGNLDFNYGFLFNRSSGNLGAIGFQNHLANDSTFLQYLKFDNNGNIEDSVYIKMDGNWSGMDGYAVENNLFLMVDDSGVLRFKLIDQDGNIIFDVVSTIQNYLNIYQFYVNGEGNYLVSAAIYEDGAAKGVVVCLNSNNGEELWRYYPNTREGGVFIHQIQETSDGYFFSGQASGIYDFDWYGQNTEQFLAVLTHTTLQGQQIWLQEMRNPHYNSIGAGVIIQNDINFFMKKVEGALENTIVVKLDENGEIKQP